MSVLKVGALIRPLSGEKWDRRGEPATSEEIAAAWGDEIGFAIDAFGPSRCLFESNFPVDKACYGYVEIWNAFKRLAAGCSADEKRDLFHDTASARGTGCRRWRRERGMTSPIQRPSRVDGMLRAMIALNGTSNVALMLLIIALGVALVLTFTVGSLVLLVLRVMIGVALGLAILVAIVR